ncbi:spore germination protein [Brevibacillus dissolubilis]|uniref:spore germination protein n=1 Tax=Brevibacillus dissolubilis TaxID=1844116 RepID=UPI001117363B|nr:spore germination protein [Brevibacillus dissolubilis]
MAVKQQEKQPITPNIEVNRTYLNAQLGVGSSFDVGVHELSIAGKTVLLYYINGFADSNIITQILKDLNDVKERELNDEGVINQFVQKFIPFFQIAKVKTANEFLDKLLVGQVGMLIDGQEIGLMLDAKTLPGRQPAEPETERIVRGAHDGFTETLVMNTVLTRRRIRDPRLRFEIKQIGNRSKTDVAIAYLKDVANPELIDKIKERIDRIDIDGIPMAEKTVEEFIIGQSWNPFPLIRYTERPDVAAIHLLEGHVLIYVDTSPSVMITPTTYFHHVQHAEEYRQTPVIGAYLRWVRFLGIIASIILLPLWMFLVMNPHHIPESLNFLGIKESGKIPIPVQFIIAELGLDMLRMAAIHTPTPLATAIGLISAILIGQIAVDVGLFAPEVILYLSIAAVGMYATPSYELALANRLVRIFLIIVTGIFGLPGMMAGIAFVILWLAFTRSLDTPYLWPLFPFNYKAIKNVLIRMAIPIQNTRPSIVRPKDYRRQ